MKCHYIYDKKAGKVWIPGCWNGIYGPEHCTCRIEKQDYNDEDVKLKREIRELEKEVHRLNRIIKKLYKSGKK